MKKNKRSAPPVALAEHPPLLSKKSFIYIGAGIFVLVVGYTVLSFVDAKAQNLAGILSPFIILGGYLLIGIGLFVNSSLLSRSE